MIRNFRFDTSARPLLAGATLRIVKIPERYVRHSPLLPDSYFVADDSDFNTDNVGVSCGWVYAIFESAEKPTEAEVEALFNAVRLRFEKERWDE